MAAVKAAFPKIERPGATIGTISQPKVIKEQSPLVLRSHSVFCAINFLVLQLLMPYAPNQMVVRDFFGRFFFWSHTVFPTFHYPQR